MSSNAQRGFVALMSVIIISAILLTMLFTLNMASFFARYDALASENKRVSLGLAEACMEAAKLKIAQDSVYTPASGGDCVSVSDTCGAAGASKTCKICSVSGAGNSRTIVTRAVTNGSYTTILMTGTISPGSFTVTDWGEQALYFGPNCPIL